MARGRAWAVAASDAGLAWIDEHIDSDAGFQPWWPTVVVEQRFIGDLVDS